MSGAPWTNQEEARLLAMRADFIHFRVIAKELQRPLSSVYAHHAVLKARRENAGTAVRVVGRKTRVKNGGPGEAKPRKCLCCGHEFPSAHAGNRLCYRCRNQSVSPFELRI